MSDVQTLIDQAVYGRLNGDATLLTLAPGGVWQLLDAESPATPDDPYVVYSQYGDALQPWTFSNPQPYTLFEYQIRAVTTAAQDVQPLQAILGQVYTLLSDYALSVSGFTTMVCRRVRLGAPMSPTTLAGRAVMTVTHNYMIGVS